MSKKLLFSAAAILLLFSVGFADITQQPIELLPIGQLANGMLGVGPIIAYGCGTVTVGDLIGDCISRLPSSSGRLPIERLCSPIDYTRINLPYTPGRIDGLPSFSGRLPIETPRAPVIPPWLSEKAPIQITTPPVGGPVCVPNSPPS